MVSRNGMYRCHLVSRVLLKQFSKDGEVNVYDKLSNKWSQKKYIDVGFIYLPLKIFSSIEDEWERVETQVGNIFSKFENRPEL